MPHLKAATYIFDAQVLKAVMAIELSGSLSGVKQLSIK